MAIPCETICPTLPLSSFLLVLNTFSHFLARQRSEKEATVLSNIPRTKMAGNAKVRSSVSLSLSLSPSLCCYQQGLLKRKARKRLLELFGQNTRPESERTGSFYTDRSLRNSAVIFCILELSFLLDNEMYLQKHSFNSLFKVLSTKKEGNERTSMGHQIERPKSASIIHIPPFHGSRTATYVDVIRQVHAHIKDLAKYCPQVW